MKLRQPVRRETPETIIALIDVVFFLLVFFLLVGRMDATAPFELLPPISTKGVDMPGGGATVAISPEGALALDGRATDADGLIENLEVALEANPDLLVRINADKAVAVRHVMPLVARIEAVGVAEIVLVVTPPGNP